MERVNGCQDMETCGLRECGVRDGVRGKAGRRETSCWCEGRRQRKEGMDNHRTDCREEREGGDWSLL